MKAYSKYLIYLLLVLVLTSTAAYILKLKKEQTPATTKFYVTPSLEKGSKKYTSEQLDFQVNVPEGFVINSKMTYVDFKSGDGLVDIVRNGKNYNSVEEYLMDLDKRRNFQVIKEKLIELNGMDASDRLERNLNNAKEQRAFYIYTDGWIYVISTDNSSLYDDLDQIAQSFQYTP